MGSCAGKGGVAAAVAADGSGANNGVRSGAEGAVAKERRRLSVNKADKVQNDPKSDSKGTVCTIGEGSILELLPRGKRLSLCGVGSDEQQRSFADKATQKAGESDALRSCKIGYACKKGLKPESPNQDDFCIFRANDLSIYGVFDGHGPYGHDISSFVQENLPRTFVKDPNFSNDPEKALSAAFPETHRLCTESQSEGRFDCTLSGTTATLAMHRDGWFYVAHVGDSRAVLATKMNNELRHKDLTMDHKPTCEEEKKRIQEQGGQVRRLEGDIPHRVFLSGKMYPGLAMTRSIGDTVGAAAGVISMPAVDCHKVQRDWRFVLLCSDGVWEFINSQEAVEIIGNFSGSDVQKAVDELASEAWKRWIKEEGNVVDDITVICAWFNDD